MKYEGRRDPRFAQGAKVGSIERVMPKSEAGAMRLRISTCTTSLLWGVGFVYGLVAAFADARTVL